MPEGTETVLDCNEYLYLNTRSRFSESQFFSFQRARFSENISMFSMCSELTPHPPIPDTRIPQLMQPWYHAILFNTMQYHSIPCIVNNCWRSVPLSGGQYKAIFYFIEGIVTKIMHQQTVRPFSPLIISSYYFRPCVSYLKDQTQADSATIFTPDKPWQAAIGHYDTLCPVKTMLHTLLQMVLISLFFLLFPVFIAFFYILYLIDVLMIIYISSRHIAPCP